MSAHSYGFGLLCSAGGGFLVLGSSLDVAVQGWVLAGVAVVGLTVMMVSGL